MSRFAGFTAALQGLGRSLMLPIAVLPVAGLLLRLGQPDVADVVSSVLPWLRLGFLAVAANAVFDNLGVLFAAGVALGFARDGHGAAALAALVGYLVATEGAATLVAVPPGLVENLPPELATLAAARFRHAAIHDLAVPIGILTGMAAGLSYNRFHAIRFAAAPGAALMMVGLALYARGPDMQVWAQIVLLPLLVSGIGLVHALVAGRRVGGMLGLFYAALLLAPPVKYVVSGLAAVDAVADLRRRLGVEPPPPGKD